jgi:hypothetical protein
MIMKDVCTLIHHVESHVSFSEQIRQDGKSQQQSATENNGAYRKNLALKRL